MTDVPMPTTVRELWNTAWVAENDDEATAQAERQYDLFRGKEVEVDRLWVIDGENYDEEMFVEPWPKVRVVALSTDSGWDGEVLYPEWELQAVDEDQIVTTVDGKSYRLGDINEEDWCLRTTAPGIGTAEGFGCKDSDLIYPVGREST